MEYNMEELLPVVKLLSEKYTGKASTSVSYTIAKQLMGAAMYCIQAYEKENKKKSRGQNELVLVEGTKLPALEAYKLGVAVVKKKVEYAKVLYLEIIQDFDAFKNQAYHETILHGMPEFFSRYDAQLEPQNKILTLDYPTLWSCEGYQGVEAICKYLEYTLIEQYFLQSFPRPFVIEVLGNYHEQYEELFENVAGMLLHTLLEHCMIGKPFMELNLTEREYQKLQELVNSKSVEEVEELLYQYTQDIIDRVLVPKMEHQNHKDLQGKRINQHTLMKYFLAERRGYAARLKYNVRIR